MIVYVVLHNRVIDDADEIKMIGVYSSEERAQQAIATLLTQPGFAAWPDGFSMDKYDVDKTHWAEGFVTSE